MPLQTVFDVVQAALGRELSDEERQLLRRLSPHGVAKLNNDLLNGIPISLTLADFKTVFAKMHERQATIVAELSNEAREVLHHRLGRTPTIDELTLFINLPVPAILLEVNKRRKEAGATFDSAVEELANEHKYQRLSADAHAFGELQTMPTRVNVLSPVFRPATPNALAPNMATVRKRTISVGLSPIVLWFKPEDYDRCDDSDEKSSLKSPRSLASTTCCWSSDSLLPIPSRSSMDPSGSPKRVSIMEANNNSYRFSPIQSSLSNSSTESLPNLVPSPPLSPVLPNIPQPQPLSSTLDSAAVSAPPNRTDGLAGLRPTPPAPRVISDSKFRRKFLPSLFQALN